MTGSRPWTAWRPTDLAGLRDVADLYARGPGAVDLLRGLAAAARTDVPAASARFAPPVLAPSKIVCVGLNYADHIAESRAATPERIVLFAKFPSCLIAHGETIVYPRITSELDYEGELAVVIGRQARDVPVERALEYVGGYTIVNDVSARDLQISEPQWIRGKALDTFAPLGPVVLDAAEAPPVSEMTDPHPGQRGNPPGRQLRADDHRRPRADRAHLSRNHPGAGRHHRDRDTVRRRASG